MKAIKVKGQGHLYRLYLASFLRKPRGCVHYLLLHPKYTRNGHHLTINKTRLKL